jgi:hypothetical protein
MSKSFSTLLLLFVTCVPSQSILSKPRATAGRPSDQNFVDLE